MRIFLGGTAAMAMVDTPAARQLRRGATAHGRCNSLWPAEPRSWRPSLAGYEWPHDTG